MSTKYIAATLVAFAITGCASHPILRDTLIATAVASIAASRSHTDQPLDGRVFGPS